MQQIIILNNTEYFIKKIFNLVFNRLELLKIQINANFFYY